jgi:predicted small metal-binding protein
LLDSDGTCVTGGTIEYCTKSPVLKDQFMFLCRSLGINCSCYEKYFYRLDNVYYRVKIHAKNKHLFNLKRKQDRVKTEETSYGQSFSERTSIISVEYIGVKKCKCVTVNNESHKYLIDDFIITHNSDLMLGEEFGKFGKFSDWWATSMPNVQEGEIVFGLGYITGTGGTEGSDFSGALDMIYSPVSNHVYGIPNVFDIGSTGNKKTIFFYPAYMNYKPYYNKDGVSDVIGAMLSELMQRYDLKYNSSDPIKLTKRKAEFAFTIQEAIMKRDNTIYPVADLNDRINQIDMDSISLADMYAGRLTIEDGKVKFEPDSTVKPIMYFPHKDNKMEGCIYIKTMPVKMKDGTIPWGRYVSGCDPYDDDESGTLSLLSCYILDLWTDDIVAEYTGRPMYADEAYENVRRLLLFYNAECNYENNKKGLFAYFSRHNCLYLLCDTLEFLRDKDMAKLSYGNKAHPYSEKVYTPNGIKT